MRSSRVIKGMKIAVELVVMPPLYLHLVIAEVSEDIKPCSCCQSSRFKAQLYFCAMPETVNTSFSSRWRVGGEVDDGERQEEHPLVP